MTRRAVEYPPAYAGGLYGSVRDGMPRNHISASGSVASPNFFCGTPIVSSIER